MDILNNILELMKKRGISQKELCEKLGINQQAFTNWKNGTHSSYTKYLPQIADILDCSMDFLAGKGYQGTPSDFWERLNFLCKRKNTTPDKVLKVLNLSLINIPLWQSGEAPSMNEYEKLADYFGETVAFFLGISDSSSSPLFVDDEKGGYIDLEPKTYNQISSASKKDRFKKQDISFDDFSFAMYNEAHHLTEEDKRSLLQMAHQLKEKTEEKE